MWDIRKLTVLLILAFFILVSSSIIVFGKSMDPNFPIPLPTILTFFSFFFFFPIHIVLFCACSDGTWMYVYENDVLYIYCVFIYCIKYKVFGVCLIFGIGLTIKKKKKKLHSRE